MELSVTGDGNWVSVPGRLIAPPLVRLTVQEAPAEELEGVQHTPGDLICTIPRLVYSYSLLYTNLFTPSGGTSVGVDM